MSRPLPILGAAVLAGALLFTAVGCGGPTLQEEFESEFSSQGIPTKSITVDTTPHEAQIMMDRMILQSHGITNVTDQALVHATVTLQNGEEVSAVKWDGKVYTYKK